MPYTLGCFAFWTLSFAFHPTTVPNQALLGHVYRSLQDLDWLNCIQSCHDDPYCFSYNFVPTKHGLGVCQMIDCGLEDLCNTEGLVFSAGAIFQQIAATRGTEICESSPNTRGSRADFSLLFPSPGSIANYVQGGGSIINLSELSVCFWVKSSKERFTVFSYIGIRGAKELALEIYDRNYVTLTIGDEQRTINVKVNDRKWHHVCVAWANSDGQWAFFKDGVVVRSHEEYKTHYFILPGGSLVLGQEQFSDKTFYSDRSFEGEMTNFNLWSRYLTAIEISRMSRSCLSGRGDVFKWSRFRGGLKGEVKVVRPSSCDH